MMSSQPMQTLLDPAFRNKMPLFDGTMASTGLSKPQNMSGFLGKQTLQYSGAYFAYDPRRKDGAGFTTPWNNSKDSLLDGRSPVTHLSGMEGENHIIYRQDNKSSEEGHSHSSSLCRVQGKQGLTLFAKSPGVSSPTAATSVAVRKLKTGGENSSPSENSVYLAIPKPVYGHNPCCNELGCVIGQRYSMEHGAQRIPNTVYEHEWMQTDAHYAERPAIQRKAGDTLLQHRGLAFEHSAERLKRMTVETYSPSRARTFPAMIDRNYNSYPCTPTHTLFSSLSEQSPRLQTPSTGYPSLYPSHPAYEHMTSEAYQECSPMSKYGQLAQHPMFYYPQANLEIENGAQCKDINNKQREDVPVIFKHTPSNPRGREHFIAPQLLHGEIPLVLPNAETLPNHPFMQGFDYSCYAVPRFNLNPSQIRPLINSQHAPPSFHPNHVNASPSGQHIDHHKASEGNLQKDKSSAGMNVDKSHISPPFLRVDQKSPTGHLCFSPSSRQMTRFFPPLTSLHIDRPILRPAGVNKERNAEYNHCETQVTFLKQPKCLPVSPALWLPQSPGHSPDHISTAVTNGANVRKIIYSPAAATGIKHNGSACSPDTNLAKGCLKRSISHVSPTIKIKEENRDLCEVDHSKKRQKVEMENVPVENKTDSPPMPVIDTVFSLAPYQTYLQASGDLFPGRAPEKTARSSERHGAKTTSDIKVKRTDKEEQQPVGHLVLKESCTRISTEKPVVESLEAKMIKVEKLEPSVTDNSVETRDGEMYCSKIIKEELEETGSSDSGSMVVIETYEPDELESKPSLTDDTSDESKHAELTAQTNSSSERDTRILHEQMLILQPKSVTPPQPSETKVHFKNIPPQCLKLSTYKIILPDMKNCSPVPLPEDTSAQLITEFTPKQELQVPVRKHFLELHNFLCNLVSNLVSGSSKQDLRTWCSQLKLAEPTSLSSIKAQKVSSLLGVEAREMWLNEEIKSALHNVLERLREYTLQERCPFPHVMRTGAVFLPMLVVKELLFPVVQGSFIDQVLQEHKVELRPTTLSEEKILIQLHKRACSSRLRRLMSLKHLPDIYADVLNLFYYACVCKHLGLDLDNPANRENDCDETPAHITSPASPSESPPKDQETKPHLNKNRTKSRVKSSSRYMFLDSSLSDEEKVDDAEKTVNGCMFYTFGKKQQSGCKTANRGSDHMFAEVSSPTSTISENSWTCPLTLDKLSPSDSETEESSTSQPVGPPSEPVKSSLRSKSCSGVILKLRKMFSKGLKRKKVCYQAVSQSETFTDVSLSQTDDVEGEVSCGKDLQSRTPKATHRWQRTGSLSHALRPLSNSSKRKCRSLLKIKYCPYLSACHSAEHRRRWVLRSAVQSARGAMRFYYPDLVGKTIYHLYEEDDKSEVWYKGEVLRIHEAHSNPLKTIFEVKYDSEPEWKYYLELLIDYKKGWLKIED